LSNRASEVGPQLLLPREGISLQDGFVVFEEHVEVVLLQWSEVFGGDVFEKMI
jgi:hypothetical protein